MADGEQLEIFKRGAAAWNDWRPGSLDCPDLRNADLSKQSFAGANLTGALFDKSNLSAVNFVGADLRGAQFHETDLRNANLLGIKVDERTNFADTPDNQKCNVLGCKIDSYTLDLMYKNGNLRPDNLAIMDIRNDLAEFRASYSGFRLWIHLFALAIFLFPYLWFLGSHYAIAKFTSSSGDTTSGDTTIPLWEALLKFIWNGGKNWEVGWNFDYSFVAFVILGIFNICRGLLLWKTINLEHRQLITGASARFSLAIERRWRMLVSVMSIFVWVSFGALAWNSYNFMSQEIEIDRTQKPSSELDSTNT